MNTVFHSAAKKETDTNMLHGNVEVQTEYNPLTAKLFNLNFHSLEVVSR